MYTFDISPFVAMIILLPVILWRAAILENSKKVFLTREKR